MALVRFPLGVQRSCHCLGLAREVGGGMKRNKRQLELPAPTILLLSLDSSLESAREESDQEEN